MSFQLKDKKKIVNLRKCLQIISQNAPIIKAHFAKDHVSKLLANFVIDSLLYQFGWLDNIHDGFYCELLLQVYSARLYQS